MDIHVNTRIFTECESMPVKCLNNINILQYNRYVWIITVADGVIYEGDGWGSINIRFMRSEKIAVDKQ